MVLSTPAEVGAVRERVRLAAIDAEDTAGGFVVRDPWNIAVHFRSAS